MNPLHHHQQRYNAPSSALSHSNNNSNQSVAYDRSTMITDDHQQQQHNHSLIGNLADDYNFHHFAHYEDIIVNDDYKDENDDDGGGRIPSLSSSFKDDNSLFSENDREHYRVLRESLNSTNNVTAVETDTTTTTSNSDVHHDPPHHQRCHRHQRSFSSNVSDASVMKKSNVPNTPSKVLANFTATPSSCSVSAGLGSNNNDNAKDDDGVKGDVDRSEPPKDGDFLTRRLVVVPCSSTNTNNNNNVVKFIDSPQHHLPLQPHQTGTERLLPIHIPITTARRTSSFATAGSRGDDDENNNNKNNKNINENEKNNNNSRVGGFRLWVGVDDCSHYSNPNYHRKHHQSSNDTTPTLGDVVVSPSYHREDIDIDVS